MENNPRPYNPQQYQQPPAPYPNPMPQYGSAPVPQAPLAAPPTPIGNMFERRIGRVGFLLGLVYSFSVLAAGVLLLMGLGASGLITESLDGVGLALFNIFVLLLNIAAWGFAIVVSLSLVIRRLHDLNLSGWAALLYFMPLVGILLVLFLLFKPGKEPNKYGPRITSLNYWGIIGFNIKPAQTSPHLGY
jgi:uncharacterized membrane protein YhaH (DUF805 family)